MRVSGSQLASFEQRATLDLTVAEVRQLGIEFERFRGSAPPRRQNRMTAERDSREELIAAGFMRDSLETSEVSSYRCSGVTRDNGRPCKRLGHRVDEEGRRWCGTHGADAHIKSPVPCAGLATDGKHCRKTADVITIVDGVDHTLCSFHDELYRDLGTIRTPRGYAKARHDARLVKAEEDEELKAAAELDESTVLDLLRARLTGLGVKTTKAVEGVIKDGLAAKKYINVTCKGCGKRSRHSVADLSTRLATVKLIATELTPELNDQVPLRRRRPARALVPTTTQRCTGPPRPAKKRRPSCAGTAGSMSSVS